MQNTMEKTRQQLNWLNRSRTEKGHLSMSKAELIKVCYHFPRVLVNFKFWVFQSADVLCGLQIGVKLRTPR